jgi:hypothetical protein
MDDFLRKPAEFKTQAFRKAGEQLGLPARIVEKDFWVCWLLRELFSLQEWGPRLTFKGGTSLSKGWKLIDRFSEDVDVVIDRAFLGFSGDTLNSKRLKKLREVCSDRVRNSLKPGLDKHLADRLPGGPNWKLESAGPEVDPDLQTLLFTYPAECAEAGRYVEPAVRIELGARSETEPVESPKIQTCLAEALPKLLPADSFSVRTLAPRRTFWEKAMLLHEETWRPPGRPRKPRMSRHYYDLWCLIRKGVAAEAVQDRGLFERVAAHRKVFFRYSWMDYATLSKGRLRISPLPEQEAEWRRDYEAMRGEMFFRDPPAFDEVLGVVGDFEKNFNRP